MWVFDGEQWIQEGGGEQPTPKKTPALDYDRLGPELQIVPEIRKREREDIPPFPMTIP